MDWQGYLQQPKKMFRFSGLCSLQKIRLPRPLGACLCYLLPQCCSICTNGLILFKTFQRIEVALAGAEAHCGIERILQPLVPTQFCPGHQIIKPLCLHAEIFLHGSIRLCEQSPKLFAWTQKWALSQATLHILDHQKSGSHLLQLRTVVGYDFHHMRKKYGVYGMWGTVRPRWPLLQQHLEATGPGWYSVAEREERLFTNRSNQPGDEMKDEVRTDD